ncbi:hypothetical protein ACI68E_002223 [Malassezia pachydermatis]|uniref:SET domain-containing protein n=1 Tax=Malassezia pachydermatis TaxID=77020 RepID=A0A0M8MW38_9BASI|nr:hypothetical protein Malapachy_0951 [Malassezia pachydermatis]KOS14960.1 hypothetical protein Malapachy_0951 [Malassezia pachydermatis]
MEELLRSLRNLDLSVPKGEQIVSLIDADPRVEKQLAQQLALPKRIDVDDEDGHALMDAALMSGATEAMLQNYNSALQKEAEALKKEENKLAKTAPVKRIPKKALLAAQDAAIRRRDEERRAGTDHRGHLYIPRQIMDTDNTYASDAGVHTLSRIDVDELQAPYRHEGRCLLVQVASRLCLYASCSLVGLTPSGAALPISLAHFTPDLRLHGDALDALLPIGTILLIREPYVSLHYMGVGGPITGGKGTVGVRVDTPSDVHVLRPTSPLCADVTWADPLPFPPSEQVLWLEEGPLTCAYQEGRALPTMSREQVRDTVSQLLAQQRPGAAWREICAATLQGIWPSRDQDAAAFVEDTLLHADVLLALRSYDEVIIRMQACRAISSDKTSEIDARLDQATTAVDIRENGPSDAVLHAMFQRTLDDATPRFMYDEYLGPIAVQDIPNAGRGLVVTRDVNEGELLLFCRAMASSYSKDPGCDGVPLLRCNPASGVTSTTTQVLAATRCLHTLLDRPEWAPAFLGLTAGPTTPYSTYVAAPYPLRTSVPLDAKQALEALRPTAASHYVNNVLRFNAFGPAAVPAASAGDDPMSRSTMPHPLPAILNHACLPNVSSVFFGDFVATRALHPLPAGTQIMHQYVQGEVAYHTRQAQLSKHGFVCACGLCALDRADGDDQLRRREEVLVREWPPLMERSRAIFKGGPSIGDPADAHREMVEAMTAVAQSVDSTYASTRGALRPSLVDVYFRAAEHLRTYDVDAAIAMTKRAIEATGAMLADGARIKQLPDLHFDGAIRGMLFLATLYWHLDQASAAYAWIDSALHTHHCMIGGGRAMFLQRWGDDQHMALCSWATTAV